MVLTALTVPVVIWVDKPSAAWVVTRSIQPYGAAAFWITLGFLGVAIAVVATLMALAGPAGGRFVGPARWNGSTAALAIVAGAASLATAGLLKHLIGRVRPSTDGADPWRFEPLAFDDRFAALPSAQAAFVAAISLSLAMSVPSLRVPLVLGGVAASIARVLAGAHWPSDVMAGWVLGAAIAAVAHLGHARRQRRLAPRPP